MPSNVVRVDLARLDELMHMVGELVISRARLDDNLKRLSATLPQSDWRTLQETNQALERQLRDLREGVMRVRLVPVREVFARMQFVIRDLTREYGKKVALALSGQETEIDKLVVERMLDPLLHLVRNAVSHGLEAPDDRAAAGKPPEGKLVLRASTTGETIVIEVEDDGRGIDAAAVFGAGRARRADRCRGGDDTAALLDVIWAPGVSTRDEADRASGRGVGMAVVRNAVEELGGSLALDTRSGKGTRFTIQLPLTLAIADALIVAVGSQTFAVPQVAVREVIQVEPATLKVLENNELIPYREGVLPLVRLAAIFGLAERPAPAFYVLVIGSGLGAIGLAVDRVLGLREIVVRPLTDPLVRVPGITGATELGDGRAVLILDPLPLARAARKQSRAEKAEAGRRVSRRPCICRADDGVRSSTVAETRTAAESFILFELAGTTYGVRSNVVQQMEMVEHVTPVPNAPPFVEGVVFSRGQVVPVVNLRRRFGFEKVPNDLRTRLVVVANEGRSVGLLVDAAREFVAIAAESIQPPPETLSGLSGKYLQSIARLGERLVLILDVDEVLNFTDITSPAPHGA